MQKKGSDYSEARKFIKNMFSFSIATWVGALLSFAVTPIVTRTFSTDAMGKINMFFTFASLLEYLALFAMNQAYMRFYNEISSELDKKTLFRTCIAICLTSTALVGIFIMLFWQKISLSIMGSIVVIVPIELCFYLFARVFLTMSNCAYRMELNVMMFSIQAILINLSQKVSYAFAGLHDPSANTAIKYVCVTSIILLLIFIFMQRRLLFSEKKELCSRTEIKNILKYSTPLIPALFLSYLNTSLPILLLNKYLNYSAVGVFSTAVTLVQIITLVQTGFNVFWTPFVYNNYQNNKVQIQNIHNIISMLMPLAGVLLLALLDFVYLIIGKSFRASQPYFGFMLLSPILYTIAETTGLGINVHKKTYMSIIVTGITIITNLMLCAVLIPRIGSVGAAIAIAASSWAMFISKTIIGEKYYSVVSNYGKTIFGGCVVSIVATINYYFYDNILIKIPLIIVLCIALLSFYRKEVVYISKVGMSFFARERI